MADNVDKEHIISNCERLIRKINDIVSAKIVTSSEGKISEIHVVSKSNRNPKQIVRDIESALIASVGAAIDHKKISIAQINDEEDTVCEPRLKVDTINIKKFANNNEISVTLIDHSGKTFEGHALGMGSLQSQIKTTAIATLEAIQKYLKDKFILALDDVVLFQISGKEAISVLICIVVDGMEEHLLGSALIKQGHVEASVSAVLNSINRRLVLLVKKI